VKYIVCSIVVQSCSILPLVKPAVIN